MEVITKELRRALDVHLYYLAVVLTLTLPDICGALESVDGGATSTRYKKWCDTWLVSAYPKLNGQDFYSLRCGVLHQGRLGHPKTRYGRVLFTVPNAQGNVFHNNVQKDALNLDAITFCTDVIKAVTRWYEVKQSDAHVVANWPRLLQYREHGLAPYMVGVPLIA
jgi:hypothetical protein